MAAAGQARQVLVPEQRPAVTHQEGLEETIAIGGPAVVQGPGAGRLAHTREKIRVPLVPPKPKEFDSATSIFISRAVCGT